MKKNTNTIKSCSIHLQDLELKIEISKTTGWPYCKAYYKDEDVFSDSILLNVNLDLDGAIALMNYLALLEKVPCHEKLSRHLVEYEAERGEGDITTYFQQAFETHN